MPDTTIEFLRGGTMVALLGVSLFFLRSWKTTHDKFFVLFASAFALMALSLVFSLITGVYGDFTPITFGMRATAFALIIVAIVAKNMPSKVTKSDQ